MCGKLRIHGLRRRQQLAGAGQVRYIGMDLARVHRIAFQPVDLSTLDLGRSEEHTSELQSLMRISYAVFCLKKKNNKNQNTTTIHTTLNKHTSHKTNTYDLSTENT